MNNIHKLITCGAIASIALTGCGQGTGSSAQTATTVPIASNVLQLAVGTVNLYGTVNAGLNIVTTYRQPAGSTKPGDSGSLLNSPTLTLPAAIPAGAAAPAATAAGYDATSTAMFGATANEVGTTAITSTSQTAGSCGLTTFGQSGGVFGMGIEPFNATGNGDCTIVAANAAGTPFQVAPYPIPIYDPATGTDPNQIPAGWGGPPAFVLVDSNGDSPIGAGIYPGGTAGISLGIDVFQGIAAVASGKYTLSVAVPANVGATTAVQSFTMPAALTNLGTAAAPVYTPDGSGGGTFAFVMPTGATDAYIEVIDYGPDNPPVVGPPAETYAACNGAGTGNPHAGNGTGTPIYYTLHATASGTVTLPDTIGPGGTPSVCTAALNTTKNAANTPAATDDDQIAIQVIAADYGMYAASYPQSNGVTSPVIAGAGGSSDLTISAAVCQQAAGACADALPLLRGRSVSGHATSVTRKR